MAVTDGSIKVPGLPAAVSGVRGRLLGVDAYLLLALDEHEHQRRRTAGLTTICDPAALAAAVTAPAR